MAADAELANIQQLVPRPSTADAGTTPPRVDVVAGGQRAHRRRLRALPARRRAPAGTIAELQVTLPAGGLLLTAEGGRATLALRRFAVTFPRDPPRRGSRPAARRCCGRAATARRNRGTSAWRRRRASARAACGPPADAPGGRRRRGGAPARRPDGAGLLLRRLLRRAADRAPRSSRGRSCSRSPRVGPAPLPRSRAGRLALAGLVLLTALERAVGDVGAAEGAGASRASQRLVLYTGALLVAVGVLRIPRVAARGRAGAGRRRSTVVIGYGLAGRLLPGLVELERSRSAGGRLEQPITYWNAEGALAAMGLVLCARLAGDRTRPGWMRAAAAAAAAPARRRRLPVLLARGDRGRRARAGRARRRRPVARAAARGRRRAGGRRRRRGRVGRVRPASRRSTARSATGRATARSRSRCWPRSPPARRRTRPQPRGGDGPAPRWSRRLGPASRRRCSPPWSLGLVIGGLGERPTRRPARRRRRRAAAHDRDLLPLRVLAGRRCARSAASRSPASARAASASPG